MSKPVVIVSECLGFKACRYNGQTIKDPFLAKLQPFCELRTVCPEVEIGLGVPRDPVRLVQVTSGVRLLQPNTGKDVTSAMQRFTQRYLDSISDIDGFILKERSPSCAVNDARLFPGPDPAPALGRRAGLFAERVLERFPHAAIEDEGRLHNFRIREHFLTRLFAQARFRHLAARPSAARLVRFHSDNKLTMMAYNQSRMRQMGRIVADLKGAKLKSALAAYREGLAALFARMPRYTSHINVLMHALGYFSNELSTREKAHFLDLLEGYREARLPLSSALAVVRSWVMRFDNEYLKEQTYFEPYPLALVEITDSGKGRSGPSRG